MLPKSFHMDAGQPESCFAPHCNAHWLLLGEQQLGPATGHITGPNVGAKVGVLLPWVPLCLSPVDLRA